MLECKKYKVRRWNNLEDLLYSLLLVSSAVSENLLYSSVLVSSAVGCLKNISSYFGSLALRDD